MAEKLYKKVLQNDPNNPVALQSQGQYSAAVEKCKQAVSLKPDYAEAYEGQIYTPEIIARFMNQLIDAKSKLESYDYAEAHGPQ